MFENRKASLLPMRHYLLRVLRFGGISAGMVFGSLGIGILGYHAIAQLSWVDSLLNASMILTGMGPVDPMTSTAAKVFASFYALFSGVAFLSATAVFLAPAFHRLMHRFHLDIDDDSDQQDAR